jgi:hypothetical protein
MSIENVAVISPSSGWILSHIARRICEADSRFFEVSISGQNMHFPRKPDAIYYVDVQNCWGLLMRDICPNATKHVGMFTHLDKDSVGSMRKDWLCLDGMVHMCHEYYNAFNDMGWYGKDRMTILYPADVTHFKTKKIKIGVCQRGGFEGKGDGFLQDVLKGLPREILGGVEIIINGSGWDRNSFPEELSVTVISSEDYAAYQKFYDSIDYLLIPSLWEGGPMAYLEALATGTKVIASRVGFVEDFRYNEQIVTYKPNDSAGLDRILTDLVTPRIISRGLVSHLDFELYTNELMKFMETL